MNQNPYREPREPSRGGLTLREKTASLLKGLMRLEPLVEVIYRGMDTSLPCMDRMRAAAALGNSSTVEKVHEYIKKEKDPNVKEILAQSLYLAYMNTLRYYNVSLCGIFTVVGSEMVARERDQYAREVVTLANTLLADEHSLSARSKDALKSILATDPSEVKD